MCTRTRVCVREAKSLPLIKLEDRQHRDQLRAQFLCDETEAFS